jgi:hypothetical protein
LDKKENALLAIEAMIASVPTIGGAMQTLIFGRMNEKRLKNIENYIEQLKKDIEALKIDRFNESNDKISGMLENILDEIEHTRAQEKIENFSAITLKLMTSEKQEFDEEEYFLKSLSELPIFMLHLLHRYSLSSYQEVIDTFGELQLDDSLKKAAERQLESYGFLSSYSNIVRTQGHVLFKDARRATTSITPLGSRFIAFISPINHSNSNKNNQ